jgi:hypothetical protein
MSGWLDEDPYERFIEQYEVIREGLAKPDPSDAVRYPGIVVGYERTASGLVSVYQDCAILVRDEVVPEAEQQLGANRVGEQRVGGIQLMRLPEPGARAQVDWLRGRNGNDAAGYNHILSIAPDGGGNLCPANEPGPTSELPYPPLTSDPDCSEVRVRVIDTGKIDEVIAEHAWFEPGVDGSPRLPLARTDGSAEPRELTMYYGHGTFIAGVLRSVAPRVNVCVDNIFRRSGAITEMDLVDSLRKILDSDPHEMPHIISLSAGGYLSARWLPLMKNVVNELQACAAVYGHPVLVAAAGNDGHDGSEPCHQPFYPAGLPGVVSVGALRSDLAGRACFSNHGDWVKVFAPGERLINAFPRGSYTYRHSGLSRCRYLQRRGEPAWYSCCTCVTQPDKGDTVMFNGLATWSGTSFATPIVAGLIAVKMTRERLTAQRAASSLLADPTGRIEGLGCYVLPQSVGH